MNTMHGAFCCACWNRSRTRAAPTPTNISTKSEPVSEKNGTCASPATARASSVLPVPGGPTSSTPLGIRAPSLRNFSGCDRNSTISRSSSFASSTPATSAKVTPVPSSATHACARDRPIDIMPAPGFMRRNTSSQKPREQQHRQQPHHEQRREPVAVLHSAERDLLRLELLDQIGIVDAHGDPALARLLRFLVGGRGADALLADLHLGDLAAREPLLEVAVRNPISRRDRIARRAWPRTGRAADTRATFAWASRCSSAYEALRDRWASGFRLTSLLIQKARCVPNCAARPRHVHCFGRATVPRGRTSRENDLRAGRRSGAGRADGAGADRPRSSRARVLRSHPRARRAHRSTAPTC